MLRHLAILLLLFGIPACRKAPEPPAAPPDEHPEAPGATLQTNRAASDVFRRAFWREPGEDDEILHAERREWVAEESGVRRWQWFLTVKPSDALSQWLRSENPFLTTPVDRADYTPPASSPDWFPNSPTLARCEIHRHGSNGITLVFDPETNLLHATDSGAGFRTSDHGK